MRTAERPTEAGPVFVRVLGPAFMKLPDTVQRLHLRQGRAVYAGEVLVERGAGWLARSCAWATRLPRAARGAISVEIDASPHDERWTRRVNRHAMRSRLWVSDGFLCERLGLVTFWFRLSVEHEGLTWRVARARALGLPLPGRMFSAVQAREGEVAGRYTFDVSAALPVAGMLIRYRGWLHVDR